MAVKDHSLDQRIVQAATEEFLEYGFQDGSLRRIAQRARLSTGALYTRYENKDALFCSIVQGVLSELCKEFEPMRKLYMEAQKSGSPEKVLEVIRREEEIYLDLMFRYYDQCILLFCRSEGSSVQSRWEEFMARKARDTVAYFNGIAQKEVDPDGVELLMLEQFNCCQWILKKGMSREKTASCLKLVESFHEAGWRALFQQIM